MKAPRLCFLRPKISYAITSIQLRLAPFIASFITSSFASYVSCLFGINQRQSMGYHKPKAAIDGLWRGSETANKRQAYGLSLDILGIKGVINIEFAGGLN